ncbi:unnamed protein product [Protopolystoma xenopodis]|uniref:Uncharacterized protein n=1 Tax=Protopolystoma xenopodis TaxID=117903 RepID=A0A3S5BWZ1_9PLAT|nr:unnamed protein product [Protopolystoma xenopodis]
MATGRFSSPRVPLLEGVSGALCSTRLEPDKSGIRARRATKCGYHSKCGRREKRGKCTFECFLVYPAGGEGGSMRGCDLLQPS